MNLETHAVSSYVARLREVLNTRLDGLTPIEHRCIRGSHGEAGEMYQWYFEVGGYKPDGMEDDTKAFNTYELHPVISAGDEGLAFTLHLEHNVYGVGVEDQHLFRQINPDTLGEFLATAKSWDLTQEDIERGVEALTLLLECLMPVLSDLKLDLEVEAQSALVD